MRTLNLSGFKAADSLSISVSQNALTAGPVNVPAWGGAVPSGDISIIVHRSKLDVAPSSVRFSVDLSQSNFDTPGPTGDATYDARLHDLIYLWDFDDPGTWTAPVQNLAAHKNRNAGKGPIEANMYRTPGTYNPSVLVIEPSSGKSAAASVEVVVSDPEVVFAGTKTICINPVGDSDFTGAPAGAVPLNVDLFNNSHAAWINHVTTTEVRRFLFKGGATHVVNMLFGLRGEVGAYFGSYGTGRAILRTERRETIDYSLGDNHCFANMSGWSANRDAEYWFVDLEGAGNFDPTAGLPVGVQGYDHAFLRHKDSGCVTLSNCYLHNFKGSTVLSSEMFTNTLNPITGDERQVFHMDDCVIQNFGGNQYVTFQGWRTGSENTWWVVSGTRIEADPESWDAGYIAATMRVNTSMREIVKGCDIFNTETAQPVVKLAETPLAHGAIVNCHSNAFEGNIAAVYLNGNKSQTLSGGIMQVNAIIDGNVMCAGHTTQSFIKPWASGITIRNNLFYGPDQPARQILGRAVFFTGWEGHTSPDHILEAPSKVYNNTFRSDRTAANNEGEPYGPPVFLAFDNDPTFGGLTHNLNVIEENNLVHIPYSSGPATSFAPVSDTVLFTPRSTGRVDATGTAHPEYAPTTSVKDTKPLTGSAALGAALTGDVSYMDILGTTRSAPADKGAWEVA